jgi:hypothetical protein
MKNEESGPKVVKYPTYLLLARNEDDRVILPMFWRDDEAIVVIPKDKLELVAETPNSYILVNRKEKV